MSWGLFQTRKPLHIALAGWWTLPSNYISHERKAGKGGYNNAISPLFGERFCMDVSGFCPLGCCHYGLALYAGMLVGAAGHAKASETRVQITRGM